jgi:hypothetical protein
MAGYEVEAWIRLIFRFCGVVENDVGTFFQMFLKMRIIDLADHDRRHSLEPDYLLQLAASQPAIERAFDLAYRSGQRHSLTDKKVDR